MEPVQFQRLVENVKIDGKLTSTVLCFLREDGAYELLSGHHRTEAAIEAGLTEIDVELILTPLSETRKRAIQLSHNAISGRDDPARLGQLWEGMELEAKKYSGLTDDDIGSFSDLKLDGLAAAGIRYEEVLLMFLPEDKGVLEDALKTLGEKGRKSLGVYAARVADFDLFFQSIVHTKHKLRITNSSIALLVMCELALERLAQTDHEHNAGNGEAGGQASGEEAGSFDGAEKPKGKAVRKAKG